MRKRSSMSKYRRNVSWRVYDAINKQSCLHIDAWILQDVDDALFLVVESRAGGHKLIAQTVHLLTPNGLVRQAAFGLIDVESRTLTPRYINTPWARRNYPWLDDVHREHIQPMLHAPIEGFKGYRSIKLHYVYSNPAIHDPFDGIRNYWNITGYGERYGDAPDTPLPLTPDEIDAATKPAAPLWSARDRSRLRTLDKLLK